MSSSVFNEECTESLRQLTEMSAALRAATVGTVAGTIRKPQSNGEGDKEIFAVSRSLPEVVHALRDLGQKLGTLLQVFEKNVETQLVDFFRAMQAKVEDEHAVLRSTKSLLPTDPTLLKHLQVVSTNMASPPIMTGSSSTSVSPAVRSPQAPSFPNPSATKPTALSIGALMKSPAKGDTSVKLAAQTVVVGTSPRVAAVASKDLAMDTLRAALLLQLQSTMQLCEATVGAVYLQATEGVPYLHRVCGINAADRLPLDVSPASGSTIATVLQHSIGVNIGRSRHDHPEALEAYQSATKAVRESVALRISNGLILPIGDIGCVMVADKATESRFSELDEHVLWSAATLIRGLLQRYSMQCFMGNVSSANYQALQQHAMLPPFVPIQASKRDQALSPEDALAFMAPGIERVPRLPKKIVMLRTDDSEGFQTIMSRDLAMMHKCEISDEDLLEAAVPYVNNLEALWRKAIDGMTEVRVSYEKKEKESAAKSERIVELEVELRVLNRQMHTMKSDIQRIKSVLPAHLHNADDSTHAVAVPSPTAAELTRKRSQRKVNVGSSPTLPQLQRASPSSPVLPSSTNVRQQPHTAR